MRILVLQLARFGDVYQTWPTLNALHRTFPEAEVHVLVRQRFRRALDGLDFVHAHALPSADILEPIIRDGDEGPALDKLDGTLRDLSALDFDRVINLSFSPFSSFVTDLLGEGREVRGYTRFADGYFTPVDDYSAYFYAQVGVGRANRYHLTDVFAGVAGVELTDADFATSRADVPRRGVVVHLGASQAAKAYPPELWAQTLTKLRSATDEPITVVGSADERALAAAVLTEADVDRVHDLTGATGLAELFDVIAGARALVGADSAPVAIASLTATPVLNLSCDAVNFWETGPVSAGSRVLYAASIADLSPNRVAAELAAMLNGADPVGPCAIRSARGEPYRLHDVDDDPFAWTLIEAIYTGAPYPETDAPLDQAAFRRIFEVAELALGELARWHGPHRAAAAEQMSLVDDILPTIARMNPRVEPLITWFQTERLRIGPSPADEILARTTKLFDDLRVIALVYVDAAERGSRVTRVLELTREIAPLLREYDFAAVESSFHELLGVLAGLEDPTNVGAAEWTAWVSSLGDTLAARDFVELADRLEHDLPRELGRFDGGVIR